MATLTMSCTSMIETPFVSSELKPRKSSVCVAGGASSNTFTLVFFSCTRRDSVNECRPALVAQYTGEMGNGTNANPDEMFMIAAPDFVFKWGKDRKSTRLNSSH